MDCLVEIRRIALSGNMPVLEYRKPHEIKPTHRIVEPYSIVAAHDGLMLKCWQYEPPIAGGHAWRTFRLDRVLSVGDSGVKFTPRRSMTILDSAEVSHHSQTETDPVTQQFQGFKAMLMRALLQDETTDAEIDTIRKSGRLLGTGQRRAAHAQVYAAALNEVSLDNSIDDDEVLYIEKVRDFLLMAR